jgi:hypothetical protein
VSATDALQLPSGDHEGLEGFRVVGQGGDDIGVVAALERIDGTLLLVVESRNARRAYRTIAWSSVARVDVEAQTIRLSEEGASSFAVEPPQAVRRVNADSDEMIRYLPGAHGTRTYAHGGTEPSETRSFLTILIASLATPAILAAGALATAGSSGAGWVFLTIALALLGGGLVPWPVMRWTARHRRRTRSAESASP